MLRNTISLILFVFLIFGPLAAPARSGSTAGHSAPNKQETENKILLPLDIWDLDNRVIRDNLNPLDVFPLVNRPGFLLEVGPGQFRIRIPLG